MSRVRRLAAAAAIAGTLLVPFTFSSAQPAVAHCEPGPTSEGGGGGECSNRCKDTGNSLKKITDKLGVALDWNCPQ